MKQKTPLQLLREKVAHLEAAKGWSRRTIAKEWGIDQSTLSLTLNALRPVTGVLLEKAGVEKVVTYKRKRK